MAMAPLHGCPSPSPTAAPPLLPSSASISAFIASDPALTLLHTRCASMAHLRQLHAALVKSGLAKDPIAASRAVSFCTAGPGRDVAYAERIVRHHPRPNSFMWNTVIRALSDGARPESAVALFAEMLASPVPPERRTLPSVFAAYARLGRAAAGAALHGMAHKLGLARDTYVRNAAIAMYASYGRADEALALFDRCPEFDVVACNSVIVALARAGRVDEAREVFDGMPDRTVATWSAMVSAYARASRCGEALALFSAMQAAEGGGVEPNAQVLVTVLGCCAGLGALEQGVWVHAYIDRHGVPMNALIVTALVDMYCKCGAIENAREVFDTARSQEIAKLSAWNSMMQGLAVHGQWREAMDLFSELKKSHGLRPDNVTFIAVLTAYGHAGMPDEAKATFASMATEHDVEPGIEHYGCLVDALARAGRLREAEEVIMAMPVAPDAAVWGALLSGCRLHGDADLGARAAREAVRCDPRDSGAYVLAASVAARGGEDGRAAAVGVRGRMREAGVGKVPGCSMIEVDGVVHEFVS